MQTKTQLANELWPYIAPRVQQAVAASSRASGGTANVTIGEHDIGGGLHNGLLRDAQAPQFLLLDGSRDLAGNLATADGGSISTEADKEAVAKAIAQENVRKPLSDQAIAEQLATQGLKVARRTVAKYREQLGLPPAHKRK